MKNKLIYLVTILALGFLLQQVFSQWSSIRAAQWSFNSGNFLVTVTLLLFGYLINIISWHLLTKSLGLNIGFKTNFRVWIFSSITRFLPGKIWQYPTRIYLLAKEKIPPVSMGAAVAGEVVLNLSLGAGVAGLTLLFWQLPLEISKYKVFFIIFAVSPILLLLFANEKMILLAEKLLNIAGKKVTKLEGVKFSSIWIIPVIITFSARFWLWGLVLFFLSSSIIKVDSALLPVFVGAFCISWLLGYIAPFAPAGLGVAELFLAAILAPFLTLPVASLVAILFRISVLLTEGVFFILSLLFSKFTFNR